MSDLRERVARLYIDKWGLSDYWLADAAIDLVFEEAAKVCEQVSTDVWTELGGIDAKGWMKATAKDCAAAIRALKSSTGDTP